MFILYKTSYSHGYSRIKQLTAAQIYSIIVERSSVVPIVKYNKL
ncbi:hypothetical protein A1OE_777 [Candidatus Endolissoclinum faulkneri L2]|uniref:Uncharacterized protein n=1 Tax=Candidatus Endolissoclinum faulkneri L2 TaxID=1193729 RepID=K7YNA0_9PROT|nr:hypothetical protein A1OE_777 [Candidatus Endolissoclinum faulkneri L2]